MIVTIGDIFDSSCKTLVNTVNCVGAMGKGVALDFKKRYPEMYEEYRNLCEDKQIKPGQPYLYQELTGVSILNFPTKDHWRSPARLSYIRDGLDWFRNHFEELGIESIAFPPLGCGNGGLRWEDVGPELYDKLHDLPIKIEVYAPYGTKKDQMTEQFLSKRHDNEATCIRHVSIRKEWQLILYIVQQLNNRRYVLHVGRTIFQKICYLITRSGVNTGFEFVKSSYGPYSPEAKKAVTILSNANYIIEKPYGSKMIQTHVSSDFTIDFSKFSAEDRERTNRTFDLMCRVKSTEHAELITTVMFAYDELSQKDDTVTDEQVYSYVMDWKPRWKNSKDYEVKETIEDLAMLGWIKPINTMELAEELY